MKKKSVASVDDGVAKFSHIFNVGEKAARPFFQNQHVQSILGYSSSQTSFSKTSSGNIKAKKVDEILIFTIQDQPSTSLKSPRRDKSKSGVCFVRT